MLSKNHVIYKNIFTTGVWGNFMKSKPLRHPGTAVLISYTFEEFRMSYLFVSIVWSRSGPTLMIVMGRSRAFSR